MKATYTPPGSGAVAYEHDGQDVLLLSYFSEHAYADDKQGGRYLGMVRRLTMQWTIRGTTQAELKTKMELAQAAYETASKVSGQLIIKHDDGATSYHSMLFAVGSGGVGTRVIRFGFLEGKGAEYATHRTAVVELSHGAIFDPTANTLNTPENPGDEFDPETDIPGYDWAANGGDGGWGGSGYPGQGAGGLQPTTYNRTETYEVEGGDPIDVVEELPTGEPYIWRRAARSVRRETHRVEIEARYAFAAIPPTIISSGGAAIRRRVELSRTRGRPSKYVTSVTYTKES